MELIADVLLIAGALGAALYCIVLSRRLKKFNDLEKGVGGAIAVLSSQVDDMTKTLEAAQGAANGSNESLEQLTGRAEQVAKRLEILVASMHDLPVEPPERAIEEIAKPSPPSADASKPAEDSAFRTSRSSAPQAAA